VQGTTDAWRPALCPRRLHQGGHRARREHGRLALRWGGDKAVDKEGRRAGEGARANGRGKTANRTPRRPTCPNGRSGGGRPQAGDLPSTSRRPAEELTPTSAAETALKTWWYRSHLDLEPPTRWPNCKKRPGSRRHRAVAGPRSCSGPRDAEPYERDRRGRRDQDVSRGSHRGGGLGTTHSFSSRWGRPLLGAGYQAVSNDRHE
jgi:hypothetical protein